ncbi:MAG TPA: LacI family DNA-binding transcriptional regulator [Dongiaceae bacterium]|jgi:DNA-binding LacI/PurR family transcriptional regulator|nr:LacI family DNA-binding transcriptional regulator [Dongiaceae bacterium]
MTEEDESRPARQRPARVNAQRVSEHAGVSRSAVSRAFTPGASIAEVTRARVLRAAEELGYQVNDLARGLISDRSRLVGLVVTRPEEGFRAHLTAALAKALIGRGSVPVMINTGETEADLGAAQRMLIGHRAEATVIVSGTPPRSFQDLARRDGQTLLILGRAEPDADHLLADNAAAAAQAAALFVGRGLRRLGLVGAHAATPSVLERETAFREAAARLGASVAWERGADSDYAGGLAAARRLLAVRPRPEAVFCINDPLAFGVMDHARSEAGLAVPGDLAVIGFDDVPQAAWRAYGLTSFRQDPAAMAAEAVRILDLRRAEPEHPPVGRRLSAPLVVRSSFEPGS